MVLITNSVFGDNRAKGGAREGWGGAVYLSGGRAEIGGCFFTNNQGNSWSYYGYGGAVYAVDVSPLLICSNRFTGNYATGASGGEGGTLYMTGAALDADVRSCHMSNPGQTAYADSIRIAGSATVGLRGLTMTEAPEEGVFLKSGTLWMTNCLIARSDSHGVYVEAGSATIVNATLADNGGWGIELAGGSATLRNGVAWGNTSGGLAAGAIVTYASSQEAHAGTGNLIGDPWFVNAAAADYHLQSRAGSWHNDVQQFVTDDKQSPCIDAGDDSPYAREPIPRGRGINLGAYGNTTQASKSYAAGAIFLIR